MTAVKDAAQPNAGRRAPEDGATLEEVVAARAKQPHAGSMFRQMHFDFDDGARLHFVIFHDTDEAVWSRLGFTGQHDTRQLARIALAVQGDLDARHANTKRSVVKGHVQSIADAVKALQSAMANAAESNVTMRAVFDALEPIPNDRAFFDRRLPEIARAIIELGVLADAALAHDRLGAHAQPARDRVRPLVHELASIFEDVTDRPARANIDKETGEYDGPFLRFMREIVNSYSADQRPNINEKTLERMLLDRSKTPSLP